MANFNSKRINLAIFWPRWYLVTIEETWRTRSWMGFFMKFWSGTNRGVFKTSTVRKLVEEEQRDSEFAIEGEPLLLGSTATTFLQQFLTEQECIWKNTRQMLVWDKRTKVRIQRKHEKFRCHQTDTLKRMYVARGFGKKYASPSQSLEQGTGMGSPARKIWRMGEDVTMRQNVTTTRGGPVHTENQPWPSKVDRPGNELPIFQ